MEAQEPIRTKVSTESTLPEGIVYLRRGDGRAYDMGNTKSVFKADGQETGGRYSISEWWLEAHEPTIVREGETI